MCVCDGCDGYHSSYRRGGGWREEKHKKNILSICMYVYAFTHTHARTHIYTHKAGTFKRVEVRNIYRVLIYQFK